MTGRRYTDNESCLPGLVALALLYVGGAALLIGTLTASDDLLAVAELCGILLVPTAIAILVLSSERPPR